MEKTKEQLIEELCAEARKLSASRLAIGRIACELLARGIKFHQLECSGLSTRSLRYAIKLVPYIEAAGLTDTQVEEVGVTKIYRMMEVLPPEEVVAWIDTAKTMTVAELGAALAGTYGVVGSMLFKFSPEDQRLVHTALLRYGGNLRGRGVANKEDAMLRMVKRLAELEDLTPRPAKQLA